MTIPAPSLALFAPVLPDEEALTLFFEGKPLPAREGEMLATALLRAGVTAFRLTPVSASPRAPYCMIGHCFDCLVEIDGIPDRQACLTPVADGMLVAMQHGEGGLPV